MCKAAPCGNAQRHAAPASRRGAAISRAAIRSSGTGQPIDKLVDLLKEPEDRVRYRAKIELGGRNSDEVVSAVQKWAAALDKSAANYEHNMTEAL